MPVIGCYTMDLYCDTGDGDYGSNCPNKPRYYTGGPWAQYASQTESGCIRQARADGWKFNREKTKAFCPRCSGK